MFCVGWTGDHLNELPVRLGLRWKRGSIPIFGYKYPLNSHNQAQLVNCLQTTAYKKKFCLHFESRYLFRIFVEFFSLWIFAFQLFSSINMKSIVSVRLSVLNWVFGVHFRNYLINRRIYAWKFWKKCKCWVQCFANGNFRSNSRIIPINNKKLCI